MLSSSLHLLNSNKLDAGFKPVKQQSVGYSDPFYSVLLKHQMDMVRAWSSSESESDNGIDPFALSNALLKLKGFTSIPDKASSFFSSTLNSKRVSQSYETAKSLNVSEKGAENSLKVLTENIAVKNNIPEKLFKKLIQTESNYDPKALSPRGAMGLGQIMPATAQELGLVEGDATTVGSVWHPESNLDASARYLKKLYNKYQKEGIDDKEAWSFAAGAYNAGMGNIAKALDIISNAPVTKWDQVANVLPQITGKHSQETIRYVNRLRV